MAQRRQGHRAVRELDRSSRSLANVPASARDRHASSLGQSRNHVSSKAWRTARAAHTGSQHCSSHQELSLPLGHGRRLHSLQACALRDKEEGTSLDLAFRDRMQMWDGMMKANEVGLVDGFNELVLCKDLWAAPPGENSWWETVEEQGVVEYSWLAGQRGRGPDGAGEDRLIKNAEQFTQCITEVVVQLPSLETFGGETPVLPIPRGVFDLLARLRTLTDLRLVFSTFRGNLSTCECSWCLRSHNGVPEVQRKG